MQYREGLMQSHKAEVFMSEDADEVVVGDTAGVELGDRDKGAVA